MRVGNISDNNFVNRNGDGSYWYRFAEISDEWIVADKGSTTEVLVKEIYEAYKDYSLSNDQKLQIFNQNYEAICQDANGDIVSPEAVEAVLGKLINFFSEFHFEPNMRFVNTIANIARSSSEGESDKEKENIEIPKIEDLF